MLGSVKRGKSYEVDQLPYKVRVYINNQVLIPAKLIRNLGIVNIKYANVVFKCRGSIITLKGVKLLRTRHTDSRQFTIPKEVRSKYSIKPGDEVEVINIGRSEEYERRVKEKIWRILLEIN